MKFRLIVDKTKEEQVTAVVHNPSELTDKIERLVTGYAKPTKIAVYSEDDFKMLDFSEIECVTVDNGKTFAVDSKGNRLRIKQRLYEVEQILPAYFIRINKSSLANEKALKEFSAAFSGGVDANFKCGYKEYVSRRCFAAIKRRFESL